MKQIILPKLVATAIAIAMLLTQTKQHNALAQNSGQLVFERIAIVEEDEQYYVVGRIKNETNQTFIGLAIYYRIYRYSEGSLKPFREIKGESVDTVLEPGETALFMGPIPSRRLFLIVGYVHSRGIQDVKICAWGKRSDRQLCQRLNPDKTLERVGSLNELR